MISIGKVEAILNGFNYRSQIHWDGFKCLNETGCSIQQIFNLGDMLKTIDPILPF